MNGYPFYTVTRDIVEVSVDDLHLLKKGFEVQQKTPVRVLHRRALATRPRTLFSLTAELINAHYFKLRVCAQAGMYIKERPIESSHIIYHIIQCYI